MPKLKPSPIFEASDVVTRNVFSCAADRGCYSGKKISDKTGISEATISNRKRKPGNWQLQDLVKVSRAFKVSLAWLVTDHSNEKN